MVLLGDVGHVESCFGPLVASVGARSVQWNSKVTWVMWNLFLVHLETVLVSVQDRCTVCAECTIGSKIISTHPMVLVGDEAQAEACFGPFGGGANLDAR